MLAHFHKPSSGAPSLTKLNFNYFFLIKKQVKTAAFNWQQLLVLLKWERACVGGLVRRRWQVMGGTFVWPSGKAQEQVPGWVPHWETRGGKLCPFLRREAKNTNWWPVTFGVAHQLSVLGRRAVLKGESSNFQVVHHGPRMVEDEHPFSDGLLRL